MTTISAVVPAHNEEATIVQCLERLLRQDRTLDEIIVVDNASTDRTRELVQQLADRHPEIRLLTEDRKGIFAARRAGFDAATSEIIARTDADTFVAPTWAEGIEEVLGEDADRRYSGATGPTVYWGGGPAGAFFTRLTQRGKLTEVGGVVPSMAGLNTALRAEVWLAIRDSLIDRVDIWEDADLSMSMRDLGHTVFFHPKIRVATSLRQIRHSPWSNRSYLLGGIRTAKARGDKRLVLMMYAEFPIRLAFTTLQWIIFRPWSEENQNWRFHRLFTRLERQRPLITDLP